MDASDRKSSVSSQIEDSISDDIIEEVSVIVFVPRPPRLIILNIELKDYHKSKLVKVDFTFKVILKI